MERFETSDEYRGLKLAVHTSQVPEIDVAEKVMARIAGSSRRRPAVIRTMRGSTALAGLFALLLVVSVTAYATSEYIQFRDKSGAVRVEYVPPNTSRIVDIPYNKFAAQVREFAKPGELVAYFVKDGDEAGGLQFEFKPERMTSFSKLQDELRRVGSPVLPQAVSGFQFEYGEIRPHYPDKETPQYRDTLKELSGLASRAADGERLFMKTVPWTDAATLVAIYSKDGASIGLHAHFLRGMEMYVELQEGNTSEKRTIAGTEVVYNEVKRQIAAEGRPVQLEYGYLNWYDEERDIYYTLTNHKGPGISKEEMLRLAEDWLEKKG
jgi:hypothetical protein